jgi:putative hemolysin
MKLMFTGFLCLFLICCSFILASSEIALFSLSRLQLKKIKDQSEPLFRRIRTLIQDSMGLLITILLFNEIVNISLGAIITTEWIEPLDLNWRLQIVMGVLLTTPLILVVCELTPKVVASRANQLVITLFLPVIYFLYQITKPLVYVIKIFIPHQTVKELHQLHEDDFIILAEEQTETGHLHETELELIKNVFQMDDTKVEQLITPLKQLVTIPSTFTLEKAAQLLLRDKIYARVPISGKFKEDIVGVLNTKDLVEIRVNPDIKKDSVMTIAKDPLVISANTNIDTLFKKMRAKKVQVAFIKNAQDRIIGMITLQDILDTIIEEAFDE